MKVIFKNKFKLIKILKICNKQFSLHKNELWNTKYVFQLNNKNNQTEENNTNNLKKEIVEKKEEKKVIPLKTKLMTRANESRKIIQELNQISQNTGKSIEQVKWEYLLVYHSKIDDTLFTKQEAEEYEVYKDSVKETVEKLGIKEIEGHIKLQEKIKEIILNDKQDEFFKETGIIIQTKKEDAFFRSGLDSHNYLVKFRDKEYKVDIEEVLNKDLFEKQRVYDDLVEENKDKIKLLNGSFENNLHKYVNFNRDSYLIYQNPFSDSTILNNEKSHLHKNIMLSLLLSGIISLIIHPACCIVLSKLYYNIIRKMFFFNNLIHEIRIDSSKQNALFRLYNFLGFEKPIYNSKKVQITQNLCVLKDKYNLNTNESKFNLFYQVTNGRRRFLLSADSESQSDNTNQDLTLYVLNGDVKSIVNYDFTYFENKSLEEYNEYVKIMKEQARLKNTVYLSKEDRLEQDYSRFRKNSDFEDYNQSRIIKDKGEGFYIDNGYR
jgi:hypothetical protein